MCFIFMKILCLFSILTLNTLLSIISLLYLHIFVNITRIDSLDFVNLILYIT